MTIESNILQFFNNENKDVFLYELRTVASDLVYMENTGNICVRFLRVNYISRRILMIYNHRKDKLFKQISSLIWSKMMRQYIFLYSEITMTIM